MYEVKVPILGFNDKNKMNIKQLDNNYYILEMDRKEDTNMYLLSSNSVASFDIDINDEDLRKLQITEKTKISIYYTILINNPVSDSLVNLSAPIIINEDKKLMGQCIINSSNYLYDTLGKINI
ncbi:flagellar assembly protein FliW [Arcobacter sp. CECT 8985]|uniref:flagellar assembly protein FliW n=1 Tax=Arcobacter sp. CECT 8985 TaxID=1935424 RepID=UPI0013E95E08|nr:flagellar assembly protein FliW [Arcobacter sp. CECT 8985]